MKDERTLGQRLVSPNGFDGSGPVPEKVTEAAKRLAQEWMRELYEAVHRGRSDR